MLRPLLPPHSPGVSLGADPVDAINAALDQLQPINEHKAPQQRAENGQERAAALSLISSLTSSNPSSLPPQVTESVATALFEALDVEDTAPRQMREGLAPDSVAQIARLATRAKEKNLDISTFVKEALLRLGHDATAQKTRRRNEALALNKGQSQPVRWVEMLLGCGIGDAFGAGIEFWDGKFVKENVDGTKWVTLRGDPVLPWADRFNPTYDVHGSGRNFLAGMYTDDCEMTAGLMHALMADGLKGELDGDDMLQWWYEEYQKVLQQGLCCSSGCAALWAVLQ